MRRGIESSSKRHLFGLVFVATMACHSQMPPSADTRWIGERLPPIQKKAVDGTGVDTETLAGPVVVMFFERYCEPCRRALGGFEKVYGSRREVSFIGVDVDANPTDVEGLVREYGLTMPVVHDRVRATAASLGVVEFPETFVIDRDKRVRWVGGPNQTTVELDQALEALGR